MITMYVAASMRVVMIVVRMIVSVPMVMVMVVTQ